MSDNERTKKERNVDKEENLMMREMRNDLSAIREAMERLCSSGSGAATGYAGRVATAEPGDAEGRSRERRAVTPGEAQAKSEGWKSGYFCAVGLLIRMNGGVPDTDARELFRAGGRTDGADQDDITTFIEAGLLSPKPDNEAQRSGRRNVQAHPVRREGQPDTNQPL